MTELGNELVNGILEAKVDAVNTKKPTPQSSRCTVLILMVLCLFVLRCVTFSCDVIHSGWSGLGWYLTRKLSR